MIEGPFPGEVGDRRIYWRSFYREMVGGPLLVLAAIATFLSIYAASGPAPYFLAALFAVGVWIIVMGWWGTGAVITLVLRARQRDLGTGWGIITAPALLLTTAFVIAAGLPSRTAFLIARPAMERIAQTQLKSPDGTESTTDVNVYGTCRFSHEGNAVKIQVDGTGFIDSSGFVYSPAGSPRVSGRATLIGGPWYRWSLRF
jgi:hypothetical protein